MAILPFLKTFAVFDWIIIAVCLAVALVFHYLPFSDSFQPTIHNDVNNTVLEDILPHYFTVMMIFIPGVLSVTGLALYVQKSITNAIYSVTAYLFSIVFTILIVSITKFIVGRPRPDTYQLCGDFNSCKQQLSKSQLADQFRSFPSSHAAETMAAGAFISLFLCDVWESGTMSSSFFVLMPTFFSIFTSLLRITCHKTHIDDVLIGFFIGGSVAYFSYHSYKRRIQDDQKSMTKIHDLSTSSESSIMSNPGQSLKRYC